MSCITLPGPRCSRSQISGHLHLRQQLLSVGLRAHLAVEGRQHTPNAFHFSRHNTPARGHTPSSIRHRQNEQAKNVLPYCHENGVSESNAWQRANEREAERNSASDRTTTLSAHCKAHSYFEDAIIAYLPLPASETSPFTAPARWSLAPNPQEHQTERLNAHLSLPPHCVVPTLCDDQQEYRARSLHHLPP